MKSYRAYRHLGCGLGIIVLLSLCSSTAPGQGEKKPVLRNKYEYHVNGNPKRKYSVYTRKNRTVIHGYEIVYYPNGKPMSKVGYKHGVRHGTGVFLHENGKKREQGTFVENHKQDTWIQWREDETKYREISYDDGNRQGPYIEWHPNGKVAERGNYLDDIKEGVFTVYFDSGVKRRQSTFRNALRTGKVTEWHPNGKKRSTIIYDNGLRHGSAVWWNDVGEIVARSEFHDDEPVSGTIIDIGEDDAHWFLRTYDRGRPVSQLLYENGAPKNGIYRQWYSSSSKKSEGTYESGKKHGVEVNWYEFGTIGEEKGGILSRCTWADNKIHGTYTEWFKNGRKRWEITLENGIKHGPEKTWDGLGNLVAEGENRNDKPWNGTVLVTDGDVSRYGRFVDGVEQQIIIEQTELR